ncbi:hypothetical protein ACF0H2_00810 [Serratia marcescens]
MVSISSSSSREVNCSVITHCLILTGGLDNWVYDVKGVYGKFTLEKFMSEVNKQMPITGIIKGYKPGDCITMGIHSMEWGNTNLASTCGGGITPPPAPTPPKVICSLSGDVTLDHGTLAADVISGNSVSNYSMLSCTGAATVSVKVTDGNGSDMLKLIADGSLKSKLKISGKDGVTGVNISVPGSSTFVPLVFSSELSTSGAISSGSFSASAVATVDVI